MSETGNFSKESFEYQSVKFPIIQKNFLIIEAKQF